MKVKTTVAPASAGTWRGRSSSRAGHRVQRSSSMRGALDNDCGAGPPGLKNRVPLQWSLMGNVCTGIGVTVLRLVRTRVAWYVDRERRPALGQTVDSDAAAMRFGGRAHLRQAQSPASGSTGFGVGQTLECAEQRLLMFG